MKVVGSFVGKSVGSPLLSRMETVGISVGSPVNCQLHVFNIK